MTDWDRAKIALSYHCVSLTDVYWVKKSDEEIYDGQKVTQSKIITSRQYSIVSKMAFEIYALNHDLIG